MRDTIYSDRRFCVNENGINEGCRTIISELYVGSIDERRHRTIYAVIESGIQEWFIELDTVLRLVKTGRETHLPPDHPVLILVVESIGERHVF